MLIMNERRIKIFFVLFEKSKKKGKSMVLYKNKREEV